MVPEGAHGLRGGACRLADEVYEVACLQVLNHLAEEADFRRCPNCDHIFVRAQGRNTYYSRSSGVTYCSRACGKAFAERERRRRIKEAKS